MPISVVVAVRKRLNLMTLSKLNRRRRKFVRSCNGSLVRKILISSNLIDAEMEDVFWISSLLNVGKEYGQELYLCILS